MNFKKKIFSLTIFFVLGTAFAFAQGEPCDPFDPQPGCEENNPDVPLDGGVSVLIAAGVAYGIKRYRDSKKDEGTDE